MEIIPDKRKVVGLVEQAYDGRICLPNFQRDFIWSREAVADLMRSIVRGYFIGSLLLLRCDPINPPFAPSFLRGAKPNVVDPRPELLLLDGQQRLSSLLYALTAPDLSLKDSRSNGAIEFKHANISAALTDMGLTFIAGYKPRGNYQHALIAELKRQLGAEIVP